MGIGQSVPRSVGVGLGPRAAQWARGLSGRVRGRVFAAASAGKFRFECLPLPPSVARLGRSVILGSIFRRRLQRRVRYRFRFRLWCRKQEKYLHLAP